MPRAKGQIPDCVKCPKVVEKDSLGDERTMQVILLHSLGVSETDDIVKSDSWLFAALRLLRAHAQMRAQEAAVKKGK